MTKLLATLALLLLSLPGFAGVPPVGDVTLYAASKGAHDTGVLASTLYTVDPATAVVTPVGPINFDAVTALTFLPGHRLLATATVEAENQAILLEIDKATGLGTLIGVISDSDDPVGCARMPGLAWDPTSGTLFGWGDFCSGASAGDLFFRIDPTTGASSIIDPNEDGCGNALAVSPDTGTLFSTACAAPGESLYSIDKTTGAITPVPGASGAAFPMIQAGADFHPVSRLMYSIHFTLPAGESMLVWVDPGSGVPMQNVVGRMRDSLDVPVDGFDALAFDFVTPADCAAEAPAGCRAPVAEKKAKFSLKGNKEKLSFSWKKGESTIKPTFLQPDADTDYKLCVYDYGSLVAGYRIPASASFWKETKKGWKYKDKAGTAGGITALKLKEGPDGKAAVSVKGKGVALPTLPFQPGPLVVVQLLAEISPGAANCWSATFGASYTKKNEADEFKSKNEFPGVAD